MELEFIKNIANNEWFVFISGLASIVSLLISGGVFWKFRIALKKINNIYIKHNSDNQNTANNLTQNGGSGNQQAGRDINNVNTRAK
ncbi:hypothetical protein IO418_001266 [Campylobacter lari]|nr:hypothetical protein [Campylobacter lari]EGK8092753.1 hypothetical protein [Campylobacter lari]